MKKVLALMLFTTIMVSSLVACGVEKRQATNNNSDFDTTESVTAELTDTQIGRHDVKDSLPDDLNFSGASYMIYGYNDGKQNEYIQGPEEQSGDVVLDSVIERNRIVEDRLDVKLGYLSVAGSFDKAGSAIRNLVLSGDDIYDLIIGGQFGTCKLVTEGMFLNVLEGEYFDFQQPWWWSNYMEEISIGKDKRFFLVGDYFMDMLFGTRMLYFNKNMWNNYFGDPDDFYRDVLDGKWTLEAMTDYVKQVYSDVNGDGVHDVNDIYGYITYWTGSSVDAFSFATDIEFTSRDADGLVTLTINNDKSIKFAEMLNNFFYCDGSYIYPISDNSSIDKFVAGKALFLGNATIETTVSLREMKDDYGMLPNPKYDENQKNYSSVVHDTKNFGMIPVTSSNMSMSSAVIEALCAETYRTVIPAYYETALKIKYARDDISSQMIDLIHDSIMTSFVFAYYSSLNNVGSIFRTLVTNKSTDFASEYAKIEKGALSSLDKLVNTYQANNG